MIQLYDYILENRLKDELMNCHTIGDKVYKAIRVEGGRYPISFDLLEKNKWYIPEKKPEFNIGDFHWKLDTKVMDFNHKNPYNGHGMGVIVDRYNKSKDYIPLEAISQYKNEDTAETIAAIVDALITMLEEKCPAKKRADYKDIVKDIRKEYLAIYNKLETPPTPEERKRRIQALKDLHGQFNTLPNGTYELKA